MVSRRKTRARGTRTRGPKRDLARNEPKVIATKTKTTKQEQNITGRRGSRENHQLSQP